MVKGDRLRRLRQEKHLSRADMERRSGLLRNYICRVENGHVVPRLETFERFARALNQPLWQLFYDGQKKPRPIYPTDVSFQRREDFEPYRTFLKKLYRSYSRLNGRDRRLLMLAAYALARRRGLIRIKKQ